MDEKELMLEGARYAVQLRIEKGEGSFAHREEGGQWQLIEWRKIYDYLTELIDRGGADD